MKREIGNFLSKELKQVKGAFQVKEWSFSINGIPAAPAFYFQSGIVCSKHHNPPEDQKSTSQGGRWRSKHIETNNRNDSQMDPGSPTKCQKNVQNIFGFQKCLPDGSRIDQTNVKEMFKNHSFFQKWPSITLGAPSSHPEESQRSPTQVSNMLKMPNMKNACHTILQKNPKHHKTCLNIYA